MYEDNPEQDLIPVAIAVRIVFFCLHGKESPLAHVPERLNAFAYAIAGAGPVYAIEGEYRLARRLSSEELAGALFRHGATELQFLDERPALTRLAVTRQTVESAIKTISRGREAAAASA